MTIAEYADRKGIDGSQREDLFYYITNMDAAYLEFKTKKLVNNSKAPPAKSKGKK